MSVYMIVMADSDFAYIVKGGTLSYFNYHKAKKGNSNHHLTTVTYFE